MANSIDRKIIERQHALENALSYPEIQKKMASVTYDRKKLLEGKALNEKVKLLQTTKKDQYGSQITSTHTLDMNMAETKGVYHEHVALARMAFKHDKGMQMKLEISGARKKPKEEWLSQAITFYNKIDEMAESMERYGVTLDVLQQAKAMVEALSTIRQQQLQRKAEAQDATEKRDEAMKAMDEWMKGFRAAARLALKDNPQWLEMLNIKVTNQVK